VKGTDIRITKGVYSDH